MKRLLRLVGAPLAFVFVLATPLAASASTQDRYSVAGEGADAIFATCPGEPVPGQICSVVFIGLNSQVTKADGTKSSATSLSIGISKYTIDLSGNYVSISETAGFGLPRWSLDAKLTHASATASFAVITCAGFDCVDGTVTVVASWTGQDDLIHEVFNLHIAKGGFTANLHFNGNTRNASASVSVNGEDLGTSLYADIRNLKTGQIVICHFC